MLEDVLCRPVCTRNYTASDKLSVLRYRRILNAIKKDYMQHWLMDNLPAVECTANCRGGLSPEEHPLVRLGFPLGCAIGAAEESMTVCTAATIGNLYAHETFINNHVDLIVSYHQSSEFTGSRIVGVEARPRSIHHARSARSRAPALFVLSP